MGRAEPDEARPRSKRVDNYGDGFLRAGARAVFADGITSAAYVLYGIFKTNRTIGSIFTSSPELERELRLPVPGRVEPPVQGLAGPVRTESLLPLGHRQSQPQRNDDPGQLTAGSRTAPDTHEAPARVSPISDRGFRMLAAGRAEAPVRGWRIPSGADGCGL